MARIHITHLDEIAPADGYALPNRARGVRWSRLTTPSDYSLWSCVSELEDGGELRWAEDHGEEGVYIVAGALEVEGRRCPADGALVVESGVPLVARSVGVTRVVHCGPADPAPPQDGLYGAARPDGHGFHLVGPGGWLVSGQRETVHARWFADSTCDTCRIALLHVSQSIPNRRGPAHHHSRDEVIQVLTGSVTLGARELGAGTCLSIPADARYLLGSGPEGYGFLNYRADVSEQVNDPADPPVVESALVRGGEAVEDFR